MKTFKAVSTDDLTGQSPETIDFLSQEAYDYLEEELEKWFQQSHWNRMYENGVKLGKDHITKKFDLVVEDVVGVEGVVQVSLVGKENSEYRPFTVIVDKEYGNLE